MSKTKSWLPIFFALAVAWGSNFMFIKGGLQFLTPIGVAFARYGLGALFMVVYTRRIKIKLPRERSALFHLFILSLVFNSIYGVLLCAAETRISSVLAGIFAATVPLATVFFATFVFRLEKLKKDQAIGLIIGFVGVITIVGIWQGLGENPLWAILAMLSFPLCYGFSSPYSKKYILPLGLRTQAVVTTQLCFSTVTLLPFFIFTGVKHAPNTLWQFSSVLCLGLLGSGIAFVWNLQIIERAGSIVASTIMYVTPVVTIFMGIVFLKEHVTWNEPIGCVIVLLGAAITQGRVRVNLLKG